MLTENVDLLARSDKLNFSYHEGWLHNYWKEADVAPIPKQKPIQDVNKQLRPIVLAPDLSELAEDFVVVVVVVVVAK